MTMHTENRANPNQGKNAPNIAHSLEPCDIEEQDKTDRRPLVDIIIGQGFLSYRG